MKNKYNIYSSNVSKPFNLWTGTVIEIDGKFQEFPTEEEAWEFYNDRKGETSWKNLIWKLYRIRETVFIL